MPSFEDMQKLYKNVGSHGQQLKVMADDVMQQTWHNDIQTRRCYLYDYYHDNNKDKCTGYDPSLDEGKIPVDLKFIIKAYKSASKEDPEYHLEFSPDDWNNKTYLRDWFEDYQKAGCSELLGFYVDIPDDRGIYWKWLIGYSEVANQFPKFGVFKCNYYFQWIEDNGVNRIKRQMWGVERAQKSYTAGVWRGDKFQLFDEVSKFWLPWNLITREIKHDMRFIISMPQNQPWVYQISKVNNVDNKGIIEFTLKQTEFNQFTDYVSLDTNEMYADYYKSDIIPEENEEPVPEVTNTLEITSGNYSITLGYKKTVKVVMKNIDGKIIEDVDASKYSWEISREFSDKEPERIDDKEDIVTLLTTPSSDTLSFKIVDKSEYNKNTINITCIYNNGDNTITTSRKFETKR